MSRLIEGKRADGQQHAPDGAEDAVDEHFALLRRLLRQGHSEIVARDTSQAGDGAIEDFRVDRGEAFGERQRCELQRFEKEHRAGVLERMAQCYSIQPPPSTKSPW